MFGLDIATVASLLVLANAPVTCNVPKAPQISVDPVSAPIEYELGLTTEQLSAFKSNTVNPYAPNVDTTTGGLRHDRPRITTEVEWGVAQIAQRQIACMWYETITVKIELSPKIYIAKDFGDSRCHSAIMEHEIKHVEVDRAVINRYAYDIGMSVKAAVDEIGAIGPYNFHELEGVREQLVNHIKTAVDSQKFKLHQEMAREQAKIDSLEEYERVNKICEESTKK